MMARLLLLATALTLALSSLASANSVPRWDRHFLIETAEGAHFEIGLFQVLAMLLLGTVDLAAVDIVVPATTYSGTQVVGGVRPSSR